MVVTALVEGAVFSVVCTAAARERELTGFCRVREDGSRVREFNVLFANDFEDGFAGQGLGAGGAIVGCGVIA